MSQDQAKATSDAAALHASNASEGKLFGTLSYVVPFFLLVPLIQRDNAFSLYHAKQALTLWVACVAASIAMTIVLTVIPVAILATLLSLAFMVAAIGLAVLGAVNAWNLRSQPLPVIGPHGESFLSSLTVK
jgi:uncharacterized membrane protein